jgi:hypothetical protein
MTHLDKIQFVTANAANLTVLHAVGWRRERFISAIWGMNICIIGMHVLQHFGVWQCPDGYAVIWDKFDYFNVVVDCILAFYLCYLKNWFALAYAVPIGVFVWEEWRKQNGTEIPWQMSSISQISLQNLGWIDVFVTALLAFLLYTNRIRQPRNGE